MQEWHILEKFPITTDYFATHYNRSLLYKLQFDLKYELASMIDQICASYESMKICVALTWQNIILAESSKPISSSSPYSLQNLLRRKFSPAHHPLSLSK
jgi:hypothetical protein